METKVCKHCGRELPVIMFHKKAKSPDGYQCYCKECSAAMNKETQLKKKAERKEMLDALAAAPEGSAFVLTPSGKKLVKVKKLEDYSVRELCAELKRRGVVWENMWVRQSIDFSKID